MKKIPDMQRILYRLLLVAMVMVPGMSILACRPDTVAFEYAIQDGQIVWREGGKDDARVVMALAGLNVQGFHSRQAGVVASGQVWPDGLSLLQPAYFSDGEYVVWRGVVMHNPPSVASVDAKSFIQPFADMDFGFDTHSLYVNGQWTGENPQLDATKIKKQGHYFLTDERYLIHDAKVVGSALGYQLLHSLKNPVIAVLSCVNWPVEVAGTADNIYINGMPLNVDPAHFKLVRWLPKSGTLYYRDQFGQHVMTLGGAE